MKLPPSGPAPAREPDDSVLLAVRNLEVVYSDVILVLRGVSLSIPRGGIVALLGANGAGKTTLLRALTGLLPIHRGRITKGDIRLDGRSLLGLDGPGVVRQGVAQVMEGRRIFVELTVEENLRAGGFTCPDRAALRTALERMYDLFPPIAARRHAVAGYLSGGEQQMVAVGRALMSSPRLLLLDEPSLGLAPKMVEQIRELVVAINRAGTSVLLVEQNAAMALSVAHDADVQEFYLGFAHTGQRSFRDIKTYRRKKRWSA
jgi:branched-chain amino acid transport system ATP-binding protein